MFYIELFEFLAGAWRAFLAARASATISGAVAMTLDNPVVMSKARKMAALALTKELAVESEKSGGRRFLMTELIAFVEGADSLFLASVGSNDLDSMTDKWLNAVASQYVSNIAPEWQQAAKTLTSEPEKRRDLDVLLKELIDNTDDHLVILNPKTGWGEKVGSVGEHNDLHNPIKLVELIRKEAKYAKWAQARKSDFSAQPINDYLPYKLARSWDLALASSIDSVSSLDRTRKGVSINPLLPLVSREAVMLSARATSAPIAKTNDHDFLLQKKIKKTQQHEELSNLVSEAVERAYKKAERTGKK